MDMADLARSVIAGWHTHSRQLRLHWGADLNAQLEPALLPQSALIAEGVNTGVELRINCFALEPGLPFRDFLGQHMALKVLTHEGTWRGIPAIVTQANAGRDDGAARMVLLVARDPVSVMKARKRLRVFKDMSALEVACAVYDEWIASGGFGSAFSYRLLGIDRARYARRGNFIQYPDESDAQFVDRLLQPLGISTCWEAQPQDDPNAVPSCGLVLFDDGMQLPESSFSPLPYLRIDEGLQGEGIQLMSQDWRLVPDSVGWQSWDHETARTDEATSPTGVDQGQAGNQLAKLLRHTRLTLPHIGNDSADMQAQADVHSNHHVYRSYGLHGRTSVRILAAGTHAPIDGYPAFNGRSADERDHLIVSVEHWIRNNLPGELHEATRALAGEDGRPDWVPADSADSANEARYLNRFEAVHRSTPIVPTYDAEAQATCKRRLTGIVVAVEGEGEVTTDSLGRCLVRLVGAEPGLDTTVWVRHVSPWAGRDHGFMVQLRVGSEVDLEAFGDDRLVIVGCHYNGENPPPRPNHQPSLPANRFQTALVGREIGGVSQQHLLFDDTPGQQMAQLATDVDSTALNLGVVTTHRNEGQAEPRGRGYELRTDGHGAVRAAEGLLITTEARPQGQEHVTAMGETTDRIAQGNEQHLNLADAAKQARAHQAGDQDEVVKALQRQADELKGGKTPGHEFQTPHLTLASPAGLETSTQGSTHVVSTEHIALSSGGHTSVSAMRSLLVSVKEAVRLFAYKSGMKLVAASTDIDIAALKDNINLLAKLNITHTANKIIIKAKEEVEIVGGTSFTRWNAGGIEHGSNGRWLQQAASHMVVGPANAPGPELKAIDVALKETPVEAAVVFAAQHIPGPSPTLLAGQPYTLLKDGAEVEKGMFDEYGRVTVEKAEKGAKYQVRLPNGLVHEMPVAPDQMETNPSLPAHLEQRLSNKGYRADGIGAAERLFQRNRGTESSQS
jgi:type VI secretion system secreted protein VgrG